MSVDEHTIELGSAPVFYRSAPSATGAVPVYLHGVPTSSDDWASFLERTGGIAPDLIGFGRSGKAGNLDYTIAGIATFVETLLAELGATDRLSLIGHDWGAAIALELAARHPGHIERLVLINPVPIVERFEWHRAARLWRIPGIGELTMGSTTKWLLARTLRHGATTSEAFPRERIDAIWKQFDQGTQRAILRLHRSVDGSVQQGPPAPTLLIWGEQDPWFPAALAETYRAGLPQSTLERIENAGHWPWLDRPELVERVARFVEVGT